MFVEVRNPAEVFTVDLPQVPAVGETISRYDGETELVLEVVDGRRMWVLDKDRPPMAIITAQVRSGGRSVERIELL